MEKKSLASALFCLLFTLASGEKVDVLVKQCLEELPLGGCDDNKCFPACKSKFPTTQLAFCLPNKHSCQCYYTCAKGPIVDCNEDISLEGCNNGKCFTACTNQVQGAVAGTCLPGNHICRCNIKC